MQIIDRIVTLVMTKCRGLSTPQISEKLEFLREIPGLLQDAYRLQGVSLHNAPLIADLPGVAATLAGIDVTVEISDGTLASVEEYLAASTTVEGGSSGARQVKHCNILHIPHINTVNMQERVLCMPTILSKLDFREV